MEHVLAARSSGNNDAVVRLVTGAGTVAESIVIALITAGFPTLTTAITAICQSRATKKNAAKQSILQMIMEDHMAIQEGKLPTNYQNVLHEFDIYKKNGGNSYVEEKVNDYKKWFIEVERKRQK